MSCLPLLSFSLAEAFVEGGHCLVCPGLYGRGHDGVWAFLCLIDAANKPGSDSAGVGLGLISVGSRVEVVRVWGGEESPSLTSVEG